MALGNTLYSPAQNFTFAVPEYGHKETYVKTLVLEAIKVRFKFLGGSIKLWFEKALV